jgi:uncharacterized protein YkwD
MKIIFASACLALAAPVFAQDSTPTGNSPVTADPSTAPLAETTPAPAEPMPSAAGLDSTPSVESATPSAASSNSPGATQPKNDYPTCTAKIRDHCKNPGGK